MTEKIFLEGNDEVKAGVLVVNEVLWRLIRDKAEMWLDTGWETWEDERPDWFTDLWISALPADMLPTKNGKRSDSQGSEKEEVRHIDAAGQNGRRKSLLDGLVARRRSSVGAKIAPKVTEKGNESELVRKLKFDQEDFVREFERRESMTM